MTTPGLLTVALLLGLVHAGHCAGMCGPFALAAAGGARAGVGMTAYLLGKTFTYVFLGAVVGAAGAAIPTGAEDLRHGLGFAVGGVLVLAGLRRLLGPRAPSALAGRISRTLGGVVGAAAPGPGPGGRFALGGLTGLLPCGVVYLALLQASVAQQSSTAALFMAAFSLGTVPVLLVVAFGGRRLLAAVDPARLHLAAGLLVTAAGLLTLWRSLSPGGASGCPACSL